MPIFTRSLWAAIASAFFFSCAVAEGQITGQSFVLAASGEATPDGKDTIDTPGSFALSNTGAVFMAFLKKAQVEAVFSASTHGLTEVVRVGDVLPNGNTLVGLTGELITNDQNQAGLYGECKDFEGNLHDCLLVGNSPTNLRVAVVGGEQRPDGGQFSSFSITYLNAAGDLLFQGFAGSLSAGWDVFVSKHDGTMLEIAQQGQTPPDSSYPFSSVESSLLNDSGQLVLAGALKNPNVSGNNNQVAYLATSADDLTRVVGSGDSIPGTTYVWGAVAAGDITDSGSMIVSGTMLDPQGISHGVGIFTMRLNALLTPIALTGQSAPGTLGHFTGFGPTYQQNDFGAITYIGNLDGAASSGIFTGDGTTQKVIAVAGQAAPGGGTFYDFALQRGNDNGAVMFGAELNTNGSGYALFLSDGIDTIKVAKTGDVVADSTLTGVGIDPNAFNNHSQVIYQAQIGSNLKLILFAPQLSWRAGGSGSWDDAANWTASLLPDLNNNVTIAATDGAVISGPANDTTVSSLTMTGAGTVVLAGDTGSTSNTGSTLTVTGPANVSTGAGVVLSSGNVLVANTVTVDSAGTVSVASGGTLSGSGAIVSSGGALNLQAGSSSGFSGSVVVASGGTLIANGAIGVGTTLTNQGTLTLTNPILLVPSTGTSKVNATHALAKPALAGTATNGVLNVTGQYVQASTGTLTANISGNAPGNYSQLIVSGTAALAGKLQVRMSGNFISQMGMSDSLVIVNAAQGITGTFSNVANGGRVMTSDGMGSFQVIIHRIASRFPPSSRCMPAFRPPVPMCR